MDKNGNKYTFLFASIMVIIVGTSLSIASISLKPRQQENLRQEKMKNILLASNIMKKEDAIIESPILFEKHVKEQIILNYNGEKINKSYLAFDINIKGNYKKLKAKVLSEEELEYPLFKIEKEGNSYFVIPMVGTGLWGPIWGYIAFEKDMNTIYGASFDHKGETPGLGAEINAKSFQDKFKGKQIINHSDDFVSISILKGGAEKNNPHSVDGITGGTITSVGVDEMMRRTLKTYVKYFKNQKKL